MQGRYTTEDLANLMPSSALHQSIVYFGIASATIAAFYLVGKRRRAAADAHHDHIGDDFSLSRTRSHIHRPRRMRATSTGVTHLLVSKMFNSDFDLLITSNIEFKERLPSDEALQKFLIEGLCQHTRFRSIPLQEKVGGPVNWVPQKVCMSDHVEYHTAATPDDLEKLRINFMNTPIKNRAVPWWEILVVEREYSNAPSLQAGGKAPGNASGGCILFKIHHAIGDGISLAEAIMELLVDENGNCVADKGMFSPKGRGPKGSSTSGGAKKKPKSSVVAGLFRKVTNIVKFGVYFPIQFVVNVICILQIPTNPFSRDSDNILHDQTAKAFPPHRKQIPVFFPTHSLEFVKAVKNTVDPSGGVTVNDVEFALVAGAIRRCMKKANKNISDAEIKKIVVRCLTPLAWPEVACHVTRYNTLLRNNFVSIVAKLPVGEETPKKRIAASHKTWEAIKHSTLVPAYFFVFRLVGTWFPLWYRQILARDLQHATSCLFSNVPGPQCRCFMAGAEISTAHIFCPNIDPYIGAMSLDGQVYLAGTFYDDLGVEPQEYVTAFQEELYATAEDVLGASREDVAAKGYMSMPLTAV